MENENTYFIRSLCRSSENMCTKTGLAATSFIAVSALPLSVHGFCDVPFQECLVTAAITESVPPGTLHTHTSLPWKLKGVGCHQSRNTEVQLSTSLLTDSYLTLEKSFNSMCFGFLILKTERERGLTMLAVWSSQYINRTMLNVRYYYI